jgi:uncharacterized surface protein with fasciclin (FAS1) repeats
VSDITFAETLIRQANPRPTGSSGPDVEWSTTELLSQIEHRSEAVDTIERDAKNQPSGPKPNRGWLLAAAVAALVVLIGAVVLSLQGDSGTDVVEPTPTTLSAPTTVAPTTVAPTTVPPTTAPAETTTTVGVEATATIAEILAASAAGDPAEFTTFLAALETAGLVDALSTPGDELTVFAPTDAAFDFLLFELDVTEEELLTNPDLSDLLLYHVAPGVFDSTASVADSPIATLNPGGVELLIEEGDGGVNIYRWRFGQDRPIKDFAHVTTPDIAATNGVVHVIDAVLVPSWIQFRLINRG